MKTYYVTVILLIIVRHIQHLMNVLLMQNQLFTKRGTQYV